MDGHHLMPPFQLNAQKKRTTLIRGSFWLKKERYLAFRIFAFVFLADLGLMPTINSRLFKLMPTHWHPNSCSQLTKLGSPSIKFSNPPVVTAWASFAFLTIWWNLVGDTVKMFQNYTRCVAQMFENMPKSKFAFPRLVIGCENTATQFSKMTDVLFYCFGECEFFKITWIYLTKSLSKLLNPECIQRSEAATFNAVPKMRQASILSALIQGKNFSWSHKNRGLLCRFQLN